MNIILISGLWLTSDVWSDVADELRTRGHNPLPVALPGADDEKTHATLADQLTGFPVGDGSSYADLFPLADGAMPFPGWDTFEGPDSTDLDEPTRARIAAAELARARHLSYVDIDSGHWPMLTQLGELTRLLDTADRSHEVLS